MAKFRKIEIFIDKRVQGLYHINAMYKGKNIKVYTNNSECFDWLNDNSNKEKHREAKRHAYNKIVETYKNLY